MHRLEEHHLQRRLLRSIGRTHGRCAEQPWPLRCLGEATAVHGLPGGLQLALYQLGVLLLRLLTPLPPGDGAWRQSPDSM